MNSVNKILNQCFIFCRDAGWLKIYGLDTESVCKSAQ